MNSEYHFSRLYSRIGLLLIHKNGDFGSISVTQQSCAGPISKADSHILDRCSYYSGQSLFRHENHNGQCFCTFTHTKGEFGSIYVTQQSCAGSTVSKVESVTYIGQVFMLQWIALIYADTKTLTGRASIHTKER